MVIGDGVSGSVEMGVGVGVKGRARVSFRREVNGTGQRLASRPHPPSGA